MVTESDGVDESDCLNLILTCSGEWARGLFRGHTNMSTSLHAALCGSISLAAIAMASPASAQFNNVQETNDLQPGVPTAMEERDIPLSDFCVPQNPNSNLVITQCTTSVIGTRSVRIITPFTSTVNPDGSITRRGGSEVTFNGQLQVDGIIATPSPMLINFAPSASIAFGSVFGNLTADVNSIYRANVSTTSTQFGLTMPNPDFTFDHDAFSVDAINFAIDDGTFSFENGDEGTFSLAVVDPTDVVNGSTALAGRFYSSEGAIRFGKIGGQISVAAGTFITTSPNPFDPNKADQYLSPFKATLASEVTLTTVLDENGLITPTIAVTDGINMNGSRISNLGAAVGPGDAVTLAQLEAALEGSGVITSGGGADSSASGTGALSGGSGSSASGEGAVSLGLGNMATGNGAVAIGDPNIATGTGAVAVGADNTATGDGAVALGNLSTATGDGAVAMGNGAAALTAGSVAIGGNASAQAANSVALGAGSVADQANTVSVGAVGAERRITNLAAGTAATDGVNVAQLTAATGTLAAANTQLQTDLAAETLARTNADTALQTSIAVETAARIAADTTQENAIAEEATTRAAADVVLTNAISVETMTRQQAVLQVNQRIDTQATASTLLASNLAAEQTARIAADNALSTRLDNLGNQIGALQSRVDFLDERISSSTAVATAMSGNAFLPDMKFNLTANVATYDGAHAGSLQIGALVSPHVALNAGVATGFNKNGKTAGRVGVTFGF